MKLLAAAGAIVAGLAGCGGGGNAGDPVFGGDTPPPAPTASDLIMTLNRVSLPNNGSDTVQVTIKAIGANRAVLAGVPVEVTVDGDAVIALSGSETDADGILTADVSPGASRANRSVTVTARSGDIERKQSFQITGAALSVTLVPTIVTPGSTGNQAQFRLVDVNLNPMVNEVIEISGDGIQATGTTGEAGEYTLTYTAPANPGSLTITATAAGTTLEQLVQVQSDSSSVPPVVPGSVLSASVSANPSVVSVNSESTNNRSEVRALFLGNGNARIQDVRVRFDLGGDPNSIGGTLASGDSIVYSDANGFATTAYIPGAISSPTNGVIVRACWDYSDFASGICPHSAQARLTVVSEALRVSIGTDEIIQFDDGTYIKDYVVVVVDAAGRAKADVEVTPSLDLLAFYKGDWVVQGLTWVQRPQADKCVNEDVNRNGVLEDGEDTNGNGALDPSGVTIKNQGSSRTDTSGKAIIRLEYPRDRASWIDFQITATAAVAGTEGKALYVGTLAGLGNLPVPADAVNDPQTRPAFAVSPYGHTAGCDNTD